MSEHSPMLRRIMYGKTGYARGGSGGKQCVEIRCFSVCRRAREYKKNTSQQNYGKKSQCKQLPHG